MPLLQALRDHFSGPKGPRLRLVQQQEKLFKITTASPMLSDLRLEVSAQNFGGLPTTIPGIALQPILMTLAGRLFIPRLFITTNEDLTDEEKQVRVLNDMFGQVARNREVCIAFYLAIADCWPALQEEFIKSMAAFIKTKPQNPLRMPFDCVAEVRKTIDPETGINFKAAADAVCFTFHQRLKRHLRYHCAIYLIMLFSNDITINKRNIMYKEKLKKTIPTLSGFAAYLDTAFGGIIGEFIRTGDRNKTICLFYESELAPAWNMLPDDEDTKSLQGYLDGVVRNPAMSKLICAPADLFKGEWPELFEIGSLETYIFKGGKGGGGESGGDDKEQKVMPPIRQVTVLAWENAQEVKVTLVAEITLPMRLLLRPHVCLEWESLPRVKWEPQFDYYTMNVTTAMLTQSSWAGEMPAAFEISDHRGLEISESSALPPGFSLSASMFAIWTDVMLTFSATLGDNHAFRRRIENLPLFRNFVMVQESIKAILPKRLKCDFYIEDGSYDQSPIQKDWGRTAYRAPFGDDWQVILDPDFQTQFDESRVRSINTPTRDSWATSTFFDMSLDLLKEDNGFELDPEQPLTYTNIRGTIWDERLEAEDIAPLMSQLLDISCPRHKFQAAEVVVEAQRRCLTRRDQASVAQDRECRSQLPQSRMITNYELNLARRRAKRARF